MTDDPTPMQDPESTRRALDRLASRGEPRGADAVWRAARASAPRQPLLRQMTPSLAVAAALAMVVALVWSTSGDDARLPSGRSRGSTDRPDLPTVAIDPLLAAESALIGFEDCDALLEHLRAEAARTMTPYGLPDLGYTYGLRLADLQMAPVSGSAAARRAAESGAAQSATDAFAGAAPATTVPQLAETGGGDGAVPKHSQTNVQEAGVDEPDIVKTDGDRIFIADKGMEIVAVDARSGRILAHVPLQGVGDLLLAGDRLLAFSTVPGQPLPLPADGRTAVGYSPAYDVGRRVRLTVFDVSERSRLRVVSHTDVDGHYVSARMIDGIARVVIGSAPRAVASDLIQPRDGSPEEAARALEHNRQAVDDAPLARWLPYRTPVDADGIAGASEPLVECRDVYRPATYGGLGMLSVLTFDPAAPAEPHAATVVANGETVYASESSLYVATTRWQDPIAASTVPTAPDRVRTMIHQFAIDDPGAARYLASGSVEGTLLNQFSMSEHDGVLRVATTTTTADFSTTESAVSVLNRQGEFLAVVGRVAGLGRTERIYAVRFVGDTGYVVTFRQVDPLYTLDLRDPTAPKVVGELKIAGYSAYLHPVGPGLLVGVGQDATEQGMRLGTQVSLFDVSDPAAPKLLHRHALGQGGSTVEYDHRAFLWWAPTSLALLPVSQWDGQTSFNGVVGLRVDVAGITEIGRTGRGDESLRSIVIDDRVVVIGSAGLSVVGLDDLATIATTAL